MKEKYTVDALLSSADLMDNFIRDIPNRNLDGGAYRQVRLCHYEDGILLVSHHNTNSYCYIYIGETPNVEIIRGCNNSRVNGNADPQPKTGSLYCVWSCGKWVKEGPWVEKTKTLLAKLIDRIELHKYNKEQAEIAKKEEAAKKVEEENNKLLKNWE